MTTVPKYGYGCVATCRVQKATRTEVKKNHLNAFHVFFFSTTGGKQLPSHGRNTRIPSHRHHENNFPEEDTDSPFWRSSPPESQPLSGSAENKGKKKVRKKRLTTLTDVTRLWHLETIPTEKHFMCFPDKRKMQLRSLTTSLPKNKS